MKVTYTWPMAIYIDIIVIKTWWYGSEAQPVKQTKAGFGMGLCKVIVVTKLNGRYRDIVTIVAICSYSNPDVM